jgi:hypothetical protein
MIQQTKRLFAAAMCIAVSLCAACSSDPDASGSPNPASSENQNDDSGNQTPVQDQTPLPDPDSHTDPVYGAGPAYVPDSAGSIGRSAHQDGSAARMALYGDPQYFWGDAGNGDEPLVKITNAVSEYAVDVDVTFSPNFVDLTYGSGSIGWSPVRGHRFNDLVGSDHVEIAITNGDGDTVFLGKLDLISPADEAPSGYASLGPFGGDGEIVIGDPAMIRSFGSSLDDNLNYYDYELLTDSPPTDSTFSRNPDYPNWRYYASYRLTLDPEAFGPSGYGEVRMTSVHASPAKTPRETITVTEQPLPNPGSPDDPFRYEYPTTPPDTTTTDTTGSQPPDTTGTQPPDTTVTEPPDSTTPPDTTIIGPD